jgi:hypothetical protein
MSPRFPPSACDSPKSGAYGSPSVIGNQLVVGQEITPGRITVLIVEDALGF